MVRLRLADRVVRWAIHQIARDWGSDDMRYCGAVTVNHKGELIFTFKHTFLAPRTDTCPCVTPSTEGVSP